MRAVFPEAGVSEKLEQAIASQAGATVGGQLWADALGPAGSDGATYVDALAANTRTLVDGLTGGEQQCSIEAAAPPLERREEARRGEGVGAAR